MSFEYAEGVTACKVHAVALPVSLYLIEEQSLAEELNKLSTSDMLSEMWGVLQAGLRAKDECAVLET